MARAHITSNGVQTINVRGGKHIRRLNLPDKVISIKLSDVPFTHHRNQFDAMSLHYEKRLILKFSPAI